MQIHRIVAGGVKGQAGAAPDKLLSAHRGGGTGFLAFFLKETSGEAAPGNDTPQTTRGPGTGLLASDVANLGAQGFFGPTGELALGVDREQIPAGGAGDWLRRDEGDCVGGETLVELDHPLHNGNGARDIVHVGEQGARQEGGNCEDDGEAEKFVSRMRLRSTQGCCKSSLRILAGIAGIKKAHRKARLGD